MYKTLFLTVALLLAFSFFVFVPVQATRTHHDCVYHCHEAPTPTPTAVPTVTPEVTPEVTPTPEVRAHVDNGGGPSFAPSSTLSQTQSCTIPFDAPILSGFKRIDPETVEFMWWKVNGVDHYSIVYGYEKDQLIYGQLFIPSIDTHVTIGKLALNKTVWARIYAWKNDCASISNVLDP